MTGLLAFALVWLAGLRDAGAADDIRALAICDVAAAAPPVANVALFVLTVGLTTGPEGRTNGVIESVGGALPYSLGLGGALYLACSPVVHAMNGRPLASLGSFAARVGGPLAGVTLTYGTYRLTGGWSTATIAMTVTATPTGMALAVLTDYLLLTPPARPVARATFAPTIQPTPGGAAVGIFGSF